MNDNKLVIPDFMLGHKELRYVCVGGCGLTGKWCEPKLKDKDGNYIKDLQGKFLRGSSSAHSHIGAGVICFRDIKAFETKTTCQHEMAHILSGEKHTRKWAEQYVALITPKWLTVEWLQKKYGFD
jgi:hypothetical protein